MNEGVAQAANSFVDALKGQPLSLALVAMNIALLGFLYYDGAQAHQDRLEEMKMLYQNRSEVGKLLAGCIPPSQGR